jgi:hypothetical protein
MSNEEKQQDTQAPVTPWDLAIYYRRIFPSHIYCKWLAYGERKSLIYTQLKQWNGRYKTIAGGVDLFKFHSTLSRIFSKIH